MFEPLSIAVGAHLLAGYASLRNHSRPNSAVSSEARVVSDGAQEVVRAAERSETLFGEKARVLSSLNLLAAECSNAGWDGGDAQPLNLAALLAAESIIRALPEGIPVPEVAAEPDGEISLDWFRSRHCLFSLSVGTSSQLAYAWLDGANRGHAVASFDGVQLPDRVIQEIQKIMGPVDAALRAA